MSKGLSGGGLLSPSGEEVASNGLPGRGLCRLIGDSSMDNGDIAKTADQA